MSKCVSAPKSSMGTSGHRQNGFTFIELLISFVIMALIFTVGFANFRSFASRQKIEAITREVKADLRLAQQQAVAGKKPVDEITGLTIPECDSATDQTLLGYQFTYIDNVSYSIDVVCTGGTVPIKTVSIAQKYPDVTVSFSNFMFRALADGVSNNRIITIQEYDTLGVVTASRSISITTSGQIN